MERWSQVGFALLLFSLVFVIAAVTDKLLQPAYALVGAGAGVLLVVVGAAGSKA